MTKAEKTDTGAAFASSEELLKTTKNGRKIEGPLEEIEQPSAEELAEVCTPELSADAFRIADKSFQIRMSNIKVQKIMAKSLDTVTRLLATIDVQTIFTKLKKIMAGKGDEYLDMVNLVQEIFRQGGLSNIAIMIMDLYVTAVHAICQAQDNTVTMDWIEEHIGLSQAQEIFFRQMEKDSIGGKVIDFLAVSTRLLVGSGSAGSQNA